MVAKGLLFDFNCRIIGCEKIIIEYDKNLIDKKYALSIANNYINLLINIVEDHNITIKDVLNINLYKYHSTKLKYKEINNKVYNEIYSKINETWLNVLKSNEDDFIHSGGDSLKAMELIATINKKLKTNISVMSFLKYPYKSNIINLINKNDLIIPSKKNFKLTYTQKIILTDNIVNENFIKNTLILDLKIDNQLQFNKENIFNNIKKVIDINNGLNIRFNYIDNDIFQYIFEDNLFYNIKATDYDKLNIEDEINEFAQEKLILNLPMYKVIINFNKEISILFLINHLICDGKSIIILKNDLLDIFSGKEINKRTSIDKCLNEIDIVLKNSIEYESFWKKELNKFIDTDNKIIKESTKSKYIFKSIDNNLINKIKNTINIKCSLNTFLFTAFSRLLKTYDINFFNIIISGRTLSYTNDIFGMFINTVPISLLNKDINIEYMNEYMLNIISKQYFDFEKYYTGNLDILYIFQPKELDNNNSNEFVMNLESKVPFAFEILESNSVDIRAVFMENIFSYKKIEKMINEFIEICDNLVNEIS